MPCCLPLASHGALFPVSLFPFCLYFFTAVHNPKSFECFSQACEYMGTHWGAGTLQVTTSPKESDLAQKPSIANSSSVIRTGSQPRPHPCWKVDYLVLV